RADESIPPVAELPRKRSQAAAARHRRRLPTHRAGAGSACAEERPTVGRRHIANRRCCGRALGLVARNAVRRTSLAAAGATRPRSRYGNTAWVKHWARRDSLAGRDPAGLGIAGF